MDDSLKAFAEFLQARKPYAYRLFVAADEAAFCSAVEEALADVLVMLERARKDHVQRDETSLSSLVAQFMALQLLCADPETRRNGHVDIVIRHHNEIKFEMLGECKIYDGYEYHVGGCDQLLNRYLAGRSMRSFCLAFFKVADMYPLLEKLSAEFDARLPLAQRGPSASHAIKGSFMTRHLHSAGSEVEILHLGCNLHVPRAKAKARTRTRRRR